LSFVGATGSTTISFILPGLFYWKVNFCSVLSLFRGIKYDGSQLTRDDPSVSRRMNYGAFALMVYGMCVFVFWCVNTFCGQDPRNNIEKQLGFQYISGGTGREPGAIDIVARMNNIWI
jgi:hypothetical protein